MSRHALPGTARTLVAVYAVLATAATARSLYQIVRKFDDAPVAYLCSLFAAIVYCVATAALARNTPAARRVAWVAVLVELAGVAAVGVLSVTVPELFAAHSVWSTFGQGYLFLPAVLPFLGLWWLRRSAPGRTGERATSNSSPSPAPQPTEKSVS